MELTENGGSQVTTKMGHSAHNNSLASRAAARPAAASNCLHSALIASSNLVISYIAPGIDILVGLVSNESSWSPVFLV